MTNNKEIIKQIINDVKENKISIEDISKIMEESGITATSNSEFKRLKQHIDMVIESIKTKHEE